MFTKFFHCKVNHFSLFLLCPLEVTFFIIVGTGSLSPAHTQGEGAYAPSFEGSVNEFVNIF